MPPSKATPTCKLCGRSDDGKVNMMAVNCFPLSNTHALCLHGYLLPCRQEKMFLLLHAEHWNQLQYHQNATNTLFYHHKGKQPFK